MRRVVCAVAAGAVCAACGPRELAPRVEPGGAVAPPRVPADAEPSQDEVLAAIQKAMNELDEAAQQCWAAAATERFDIAGELLLQIDIAPGTSQASVVQDTARNARLAACVVQLLSRYPWAPPLRGRSIQLPFKFRAPSGQNTIDRSLVAWNGQGKVSVAVLLDDNNAGNDAASMFELAIAAGGSTGLRRAERAELWYFLGAGQVTSGSGAPRAVAAGDMMYTPRGSAREVAAPDGLHAMIVVVPGGREGAARSGALPTREAAAGGATGGARATRSPVILPAAGARTHGAATIFAEPATTRDSTFAASVIALPAGTTLADHVHAGEAELWYVLAGSGTLSVQGIDVPVTSTSVVQIPRNARHAFTATGDVRAIQIFTPAGPEQRLKASP